jgi:hypothetical protein
LWRRKEGENELYLITHRDDNYRNDRNIEIEKSYIMKFSARKGQRDEMKGSVGVE